MQVTRGDFPARGDEVRDCKTVSVIRDASWRATPARLAPSLRAERSNLEYFCGKILDYFAALAMTLLMQWWRVPQRCRRGEGRDPYPRLLLWCRMGATAVKTTLTGVMGPGSRRDDTEGVATSKR